MPHFDTPIYWRRRMSFCLDTHLLAEQMASQSLAASSDQVKETQDDDYEFEDPIEAWIDLCEACRILNVDTRRSQMGALIFKAKNSHWTHELMEAEMVQKARDQEEYHQGVDDTGSYSSDEDQQELGEEMGS